MRRARTRRSQLRERSASDAKPGAGLPACGTLTRVAALRDPGSSSGPARSRATGEVHSGSRLHRCAALLLLSALVLTACGKKGPPDPPGPPSEIIWPHAYPSK
ncbi:MAG TPA: lipoprotein [Acetobacteraceae bacterium]|nr:lipoprotein [Acetobacteraceae bacterium]